MPDACSIIKCKVMRGSGIRLFRIPAVHKSVKNLERKEQETRRRNAWIRAINRRLKDGQKYDHWRVCANHFISGAPAHRTDERNPDWVPNQNLGYTSTLLPKKSALARMKRTVERAKHANSHISGVVPRSHVTDFINMDAAMVHEDNNIYSSDQNESELQKQFNFTQFRGTLPIKSEEYEPYSHQNVKPQLNNTCRLCLSENMEHTVSIYPSTMMYDNQTTVAQSIEKLTDTQVSEFDGLPPTICSNCYEALEFIHKFQQKCLESISQLQSINLQNDTKLLEIVIEQNADANPEFVDVTDARIVTENIMKFKDYSDFEMFSQDKSTKKAVKEITKNPNNNRDAHTLCTICGALIRNFYYERHVNKHLGVEPYRCSGCPKSFASQAYLSSHYRDMHTGNKYECSICGVKQSRKAAIRIHMKYHFEPTDPCPVCGKKFRFKHQIRKHMMVHTGERPISCELCTKSCRNKYQLQVHMRVHTKEKPYKCLECDINFTYNYQLKVHKERHHPQQYTEATNPVSLNYEEFLTEMPESVFLTEVQEI